MSIRLDEHQVKDILQTLEVRAFEILGLCYSADPNSIPRPRDEPKFNINSENVEYYYGDSDDYWSFPIGWLFNDAPVQAEVERLKTQRVMREERLAELRKMREIPVMVVPAKEYELFKRWKNEVKE